MNIPSKKQLKLALCLCGTFFVASCDTRASRTQKAFDQYQAASTSGDRIAMRNALLQLTAANEDQATYWIELGKVQYALGAVGAAFDAFSRANELNRSDAETLRYLTQIAIQSGALEIAEERANDLDLVAPGDPVVKLTKGLIALRRQNFDEAILSADAILGAAPSDTNALILKARALVGLDKPDDAVALLEEQLIGQPRDGSLLRLLMTLHRRAARWAVASKVGLRILAVEPTDLRTAEQTIEAALKSSQPEIARAVSLSALKPDTAPAAIARMLEVWSDYWSGVIPVAIARQLGKAAGPAQRVAYARYLNRSGAAEDARALLADQAGQKASPATVDALAVYAESLSRLGRTAEARSRLQAILDGDQTNVDALRAMTEVLLASGDKAQALNLARRLVAVDPETPQSRFVLARVFEASGDRDSARRSLWDGFHEIRGSERLYRALRASLGNDGEAVSRLDREYSDQRDRQLMQDGQ